MMKEGHTTQSLAGVSILVVEDEIITGLMFCHEIASAGGISIGPVNSLADASKEIESRMVDLVVLDAKLIDGSGEDLTARLKERRIPYVVVSGYEKASLPMGLRGAPFVAKPISVPLLMEAIETVATDSDRFSPSLVAGVRAMPKGSPGQQSLDPKSRLAPEKPR